MLAGWIGFLVVLARADRAMRWIMGPLGLLLLYALFGLVSSLILSIDPIDASYWGGNYLALVMVMLAIVSVDNALPVSFQTPRLQLDCVIGIDLCPTRRSSLPGSSSIVGR